ncbi:hypothetical protein BGW39_000209 [Mortierella sp. 14UC]|nr:hypothetical protein BGW39_000209 [Mortierella sp. 14UC]
MITQEAWGRSVDADISSEGGASHGQLEEDDELASYNSDYSYQDSINMSGEDRGPDSDGDENMQDDNSTISSSQRRLRRRGHARSASLESDLGDPSLLVNAMPHQLGPMDQAGIHRSPPSSLLSPPEDTDALAVERLNAQILRQLHVRDEPSRHFEMKRQTLGESPGLMTGEKQDEGRSDEGAEPSDGDDTRSTNSNGTDGGLPELSVTFVDPKGSHFEELLYWLCTGDSNRWIRFFTPENYGSILQNILHLNIVTSTVLDICMAFEASTAPELGLRGMALSVLCGYSPPTSSDTNFELECQCGGDDSFRHGHGSNLIA